MLERNLVTSLLLYESIRTTRKSAKVIQPIVDRIIASAKRQSGMLAIRSINRVVTDKNACRKVLEVFVDRYKSRPSGFTKMVPAGARKGDGAELVDLMLLDQPAKAAASDEKKKKSQKKNSSLPAEARSAKADASS